METRDVPCTQCGNAVHMITGSERKKTAETVSRTTQVGSCSNPGCPTNAPPSIRKTGTPRP